MLVLDQGRNTDTEQDITHVFKNDYNSFSCLKHWREASVFWIEIPKVLYEHVIYLLWLKFNELTSSFFF